jgi:hypothetical protein
VGEQRGPGRRAARRPELLQRHHRKVGTRDAHATRVSLSRHERVAQARAILDQQRVVVIGSAASIPGARVEDHAGRDGGHLPLNDHRHAVKVHVAVPAVGQGPIGPDEAQQARTARRIPSAVATLRTESSWPQRRLRAVLAGRRASHRDRTRRKQRLCRHSIASRSWPEGRVEDEPADLARGVHILRIAGIARLAQNIDSMPGPSRPATCRTPGR